MKLPSFITLLLAAALACVASSSVAADDAPAYPGQPNINGALKHLSAAKEKAPTDAAGAIAELAEASDFLSHAIHNKGTYVTIARQLTEQATQHMKKGEPDKAVHKIDEAIANVNRAGQTGKH